jgi:sporulation protein YlmC with PRC-barrel domain
MLRTAGELKGVTIDATDGDIGSVQDLYFDDHTWTVRYLVVDTGTWLPGRQVLISPFAFQVVPGASRLRTSLTKEQVRNSPSVESDRPVDRQREIEFSQYYGYPHYWAGPYRWGELAYPALPVAPQPIAVDREVEEMIARERESADPHLRSARDVMGYYIQATDGDLGHVEDFLVDADTWAIRYSIVDTRNWLPGRKVLVSPEWIQRVSWEESKVYVDLSKRHIEAAPEFDPSIPLAREHEERLYTHLGRAKYWEREPRAPEGRGNGKT